MANGINNVNCRNIPILTHELIKDSDCDFPNLMKAEIDPIENLLYNYLETVPLNERITADHLIDGYNFTVKNEPKPHIKSSTDFNRKINTPFLQELPNLKSLKKKKHTTTPKLKYSKFFWMEPRLHIEKDACPPNDTIYQIQIYRSGIVSMPRPKLHIEKDAPHDTIYQIQIYRSGPLRSLLIDQIISIRGSQTLAELRDLILCTEDYTCPKDISNDPSALARGQRNEFTSSIFYIENVFYVDNRTEEIDHDLVQDVLRRDNLSTLSVKSFNSTTIDKIGIKFGQAYFFKHQSSCEHKICFSDIRYCHDEISPLPVYPFTSIIVPKQSKSCFFCGLFLAKWMITKSKRTFTDPSFVCDDCFSSYFYIDRKKIENFEAYEYNDPVLANYNYYKILSINNNFKFASDDENEDV